MKVLVTDMNKNLISNLLVNAKEEGVPLSVKIVVSELLAAEHIPELTQESLLEELAYSLLFNEDGETIYNEDDPDVFITLSV